MARRKVRSGKIGPPLQPRRNRTERLGEGDVKVLLAFGGFRSAQERADAPQHRLEGADSEREPESVALVALVLEHDGAQKDLSAVAVARGSRRQGIEERGRRRVGQKGRLALTRTLVDGLVVMDRNLEALDEG